jgi:tight adherence protein B
MANLDLTLVPVLAISCFSFSLFWLCQSALENGSKRYKSVFEEQTNTGLRDLFVFIDPGAIWVPLMMISTCGAALTYLFLESWLLCGLIFLFFMMMPPHLIRRAKKSRKHAFDQQLPQVCIRLSASLKSGMSLFDSIRALVTTTEAPLSQEFSLMLRENRMGIPLDQSLYRLQMRMSTESCRIFTAALVLSLRSGGAVAILLDQVGQTISQRLLLARKLKMLTSQGKMQAWCIGLLPIIVLLVLTRMDPDVTGNMIHDDLGRVFLGLLVFLEITGVLLLRSMLRLRV